MITLGMSSYVSDNAVGALFVGLPQVFAEMGGAGTVVGIAFFVALTLAALTTTIALLELLVAVAFDTAGWTRRRAALVAGSAVALGGLWPALDVRVLAWMDRLAGNLLIIVCGLALAVFVGWRLREPMDLVEEGAEGVRWFLLWRWLLRIPVPLVLAVVLYGSVVRIFF
jgi:NSS family neurotransmitter:Na+ symporter